MSFVKYHNTTRNTDDASQIEVPSLKENKDLISIDGYQKYTLSKLTGSISCKSNAQKYNVIANVLEKLYKKYNCNTLLDIGCSNGMFLFTGLNIGFGNVCGIEHDAECVKIIQMAGQYSAISPEKLQIIHASLQEKNHQNVIEKYDVVMALAVVHWLYSCTANYGALKTVIDDLSKQAGRFFIIEWIDPTDAAIRLFKHTSHNLGIQKEPYTHQNFLNALNKGFDAVIDMGATNAPVSTRRLYIAFRSVEDAIEWKHVTTSIERLPYTLVGSHIGRVTSDKRKIVVKEILRNQYTLGHNVLEREVYWLTKFETKGPFPKLLRFNKEQQKLEIEYCGTSCATIPEDKWPKNWKRQIEDICSLLDEWNCKHNDIKPSEWIVDEHGTINLCDFGFASLKDTNDLTINGRYGVKVPPSRLKGSDFPDNWVMAMREYDLFAQQRRK